MLVILSYDMVQLVSDEVPFLLSGHFQDLKKRHFHFNKTHTLLYTFTK